MSAILAILGVIGTGLLGLAMIALAVAVFVVFVAVVTFLHWLFVEGPGFGLIQIAALLAGVAYLIYGSWLLGAFVLQALHD